MNKKPIILGIESSCDETAASIITENQQGMPTILSSIVSSQVDVHKEFGGVVPELAARSHMEKIDLIKVDIEGHEYFALAKGGRETLKYLSTGTRLIVEINDSKNKNSLLKVFEEHDYAIKVLTNDYYMFTKI